ncbi:MAG: oligosaccharide repeat unit polymerase [Rhodobacteraceae bacterium]|nr:oligosaccharide repeat unit polymerase [Paracoccaceae bacterium]
MTLVTVALISFFFVVLKRLTNSVTFSNMSIFLGVWILLLFLFLIRLRPFEPLSLELQLYLTTFFALYAFSYFLTAAKSTSKARVAKPAIWCDRYRASIGRFAGFFFILWAALFLLFINSIQANISVMLLVTQGGARKALSELHNINLWFYLFGYLFLIAATMRPWGPSIFWRVLMVLAFVIVLASMLLTAAKVNFVSAIFLVYVVWFNKVPRSKMTLLRHAVYVVFGLYFFIFSFSLFTGKVIDANVGSTASFADILHFGANALFYPYDYLVSSLAALNKVFLSSQNHSYAFGSTSFFSLYKILTAFGLLTSDISLPSQFQSFVTVGGVNTNIYTIFYDLIFDFGIFSSLFMGVFLGLFHGTLDKAEYYGARPSLSFLSQISKLSALLSFINFRYGDTIFILAVSIWLAALLLGHLTTSPRRPILSMAGPGGQKN